MTDRIQGNINDTQSHHPSDIEVLVGRIVDGEATEEQRSQFELLAANDSALWKMLALQHQDMAMLAHRVEPILNRAERVNLPQSAAAPPPEATDHNWDEEGDCHLTPRGSGSRNPVWWLALSGWAAVLFIVLGWSAGMFSNHLPADNGPQVIGARSATLTPEQNLDAYLQAPYVLGEMPATLLNVDELTDGRLAVSYLRRIVEVRYFNSAEDIPLDDDGTLFLTRANSARIAPDSARPN